MRDRSLAFVEELRYGKSHQPLVLAAGTGAYLYLLGPAINQYKNQYDGPLRLLTKNRESTIDAIVNGNALLGVAPLTTKHLEIAATPLTEVDQVLVVPNTHRLSKRKRINLSDLADESLILPPPDQPHRIAVEQALMEKNIPWNLSVEARGWELIIQFVGLGVGIAVVNGCCHIPQHLSAITVRDLPKIHYHILERRDGWKSPAAENMKHLLLAHKSDWKTENLRRG